MESEVRDAFAEWLRSWEWSHFYTVTYRWPRKPHLADGLINQTTKVLRDTCGVRRFFLGTELHVSRTLHLHGLLAIPSGYSRHVAAHVWSESFQRWGRSSVLPVQSHEAVTDYVSKYVTKELTAWWLQA